MISQTPSRRYLNMLQNSNKRRSSTHRRGNLMIDVDSRLIRTEAQEDCGFLTKQRDPYTVLSEIFGEKFKEYRQQWERVSNFELETDFPLQLDFELNYSCNLRCPMCTWSI